MGRYKVVRCDQCGEMMFFEPGVGWARIEKIVREHRWVLGKKHLCPHCRDATILQGVE